MKEELYPGANPVQPMRYHNKLADKKVKEAMTNGEWLFQEKKDGAFYQLVKTADGDVYLFGRTISKVTNTYTEKSDNVPHIVNWAKAYLPNDTILLGEIYVPGGKSNDVTKIMGALPDKAYKRQFETEGFEPVHYYIFDCLKYHGEDITNKPFDDRFRVYVEEYLMNCYCVFDLMEMKFESLNPYIEIAKTWKTRGSELLAGEECDSLYEKLEEIFDKGGEGAVLKRGDCPYRPGSRTQENFKLKEHIDSVDLVCIELLDPEMEYSGKELHTWPYWMTKDMFNGGDYDGFPRYLRLHEGISQEELDEYKEKWCPGNEPIPVTKPYYYSWKNGIRLGAYDKDGNLVDMGRVASGLTDEIREDMAENPDNYLGKVIECACMSINKEDRSLRHPVFISVRNDKDPSECLLEEL